VRTNRLARHPQPPRELPRLDPCRPVPSDVDRPTEPEPAQQVHSVGAERGCAASRGLKLLEVRSCRCDRYPVRVDQSKRLAIFASVNQPADLRHHRQRQIARLLLLLLLIHAGMSISAADHDTRTTHPSSVNRYCAGKCLAVTVSIEAPVAAEIGTAQLNAGLDGLDPSTPTMMSASGEGVCVDMVIFSVSPSVSRVRAHTRMERHLPQRPEGRPYSPGPVMFRSSRKDLAAWYPPWMRMSVWLNSSGETRWI
jgi:hypothetical protein